MTATIIITSGKDGVGKTNIGVNAAMVASRQNFRICLFDANLGLASTNILSKFHPGHNLDNFISGDKKLDEIILHSNSGIDIILGSSNIEKMAQLKDKKISNFIASFSQVQSYDYFIIDTSSGISRNLLAFCLSATETVLIITSEATSLTEAYLLLEIMSLNGYEGTVKIIVNKCPSIPVSKRTYLRFETVAAKSLNIKMNLVGVVLNDPNIAAAARGQKPLLTLYPNSIASQCIRTMTSTLLEGIINKKDEKEFNRFWQNYFNFLQSDLLLTAKFPKNPATRASILSQNHQNIGIPSPTGIIPFPHSNGIINPLILASPITLLSKSLKLGARGTLSQNELITIFCSDPALMVRAIQMFSYSKPGGLNRITKVSQIFENPGMEVLSSLLTTTSMRRALTVVIAPDNHFLNNFWYHSYSSALLAEQIAKAVHYPYPEEAFLAGLVHDIGRLALQTEYPQVYTQFSNTLRDEEKILKTERNIFGQTHAQIGAETLREYHISSPVVDAVRYHTESESRIKTGFELVKIISIASRIAGFSQDNIQSSFDLGESLLHLPPDKLQTAFKTANRKLDQMAEYFHISHTKETENDDTETKENDLRDQAVNYSILQNALPNPAGIQKQPQIIHMIHQSLNILFGINISFILIADDQRSSLHAVGYPNCFGEEILSDISISLNSRNSLIVEAFTKSELKISTDSQTNQLSSLADEQIKGLLASRILVCVPMTAHSITRGVIIFGIRQKEIPDIHKQQKRLKQFGSRSANTLLNSEC